MSNNIIKPNRVYNTVEAAKLLGINPQTMIEYCRTGKIVAKKIGEWKILGQSIVDFLSKPHTGATMADK